MNGSNFRLATAPDRLHWRCEPLAVDVECVNAVLKMIREQGMDGHRDAEHSRLQRCGILFGEWTQWSIRILAARPVQCEYKSRPSLMLSEDEEASLLQALAATRSEPELRTLQPIGIYFFDSQRRFSVAVVDVRIFQRDFQNARPMALMLQPTRSGQIRAGFFVREKGVVSYFRADEVPPSLESPQQAFAGNPQHETAALPPNQAVPGSRQSFRRRVVIGLSSFLPTGEKWTVGRKQVVGAIAMLGCCAAATLGLWIRSTTVGPMTIPMRITNTGSQLRINWDASVEPVLSATSGVLEIRDGESEPVHLPFAADVLRAGSVIYKPTSDTIQVRMRLNQRKGAPVESVIYYINPAGTQPAHSVALGFPINPKAERSVEGDPALVVPPAVDQQAHPAGNERQQPINAKRATQKIAQPGNRSRKPRVFRLPPMQTSTSSASRIRADLLDAPDVRISQSVLPPLLLASAATLTPSAIQARPSWGRLIWTGELQKNEFISFTASGSSRGVLNGRLPGFPIKVSAHPGEVVDGGIAILTNDPNRAGVNEPLHARNGWDVVVNKWVQKPIPELRVIEAPGPSNNWGRIVLQNGNRYLPVVVVDWQSIGSTKPND